MKQIALVRFEDFTQDEERSLVLRRAARVVAVDAEGRAALMHSGKYGYYKLPGGGVKGGEDLRDCAVRECREETGAPIVLLDELGVVTEYRKKYGLLHRSYGFLAKVAGPIGEPEPTAAEIEEGFEPVWLSLPEALAAVAPASPDKYESRFIAARESALLREAQRLIKAKYPIGL